MAIGTAAAIGLAAAGVGSAISAGSQKSAANKAADTSLQVAQQNNALAREVYGQNQAALAPFMSRGNAAGDQINALLGLGGAGPSNAAPQSALAGYSTAPTRTYTPAAAGYGMSEAQMLGGREDLAYSPRQYGSFDPRDGGGIPGPGIATPAGSWNTTAGPTYSGTPGTSNTQAAQSSFDIFRNSTGYQFRLGEGMNALNSGYAGASILQSGAALRGATEYGQNFASNEFGNYMGYLANQQGVGLSGAGALAGVSTNYANNVQANNQSAADARANVALIAGNNNPFANALGMVGGAAFQYGMRG